jgi:hypothetical protein
MKTRILAAVTMAGFLILARSASAQSAAAGGGDKPAAQTAAKPATPQSLNTQEYITLLRKNVRGEKAKLMGAVMLLDADDAARFWPIYKEYDGELAKLNDMRVSNIHDYAENYMQMTDGKADELVRNAFDFQKQRDELLAKYYGKVKDSLGAVTAARFVQVEHQLLLIIDLQIASELPVVGS